ncbi:MAG: hypothetical protein NTV38_13550 [Chloroflexi bacterium]|nr:hypothetical protein [Chloroflexota bacterium]
MSYKLLSIVLIVIGVLFLAVSLLADVIGLGHLPDWVCTNLQEPV